MAPYCPLTTNDTVREAPARLIGQTLSARSRSRFQSRPACAREPMLAKDSHSGTAPPARSILAEQQGGGPLGRIRRGQRSRRRSAARAAK